MRSQIVGDKLVLYEPKDAIVRQRREYEVCKLLESKGFQRVYTPHICLKSSLAGFLDASYMTIPSRKDYSLSIDGPLDDADDNDRYTFGFPKSAFHVFMWADQHLTVNNLPIRMYEVHEGYDFLGDPYNFPAVAITSICQDADEERALINSFNLKMKVVMSLGEKLVYHDSDNSKKSPIVIGVEIAIA